MQSVATNIIITNNCCHRTENVFVSLFEKHVDAAANPQGYKYHGKRINVRTNKAPDAEREVQRRDDRSQHLEAGRSEAERQRLERQRN